VLFGQQQLHVAYAYLHRVMDIDLEEENVPECDTTPIDR
jgi:hypothetical protein